MVQIWAYGATVLKFCTCYPYIHCTSWHLCWWLIFYAD